MEAPSFSLGRVQRLTKEQQRKEKQWKEKCKAKKLYTISSPLPPFQRWILLPCSLDYKFMIDVLPGTTYLQKIKSLSEYGSTFLTPCKSKSTLFPDYKPNPAFLASLKARKIECKRLLLENQKLRWRFKRFVTLWRIKRFRIINDTDFITLAPISNPISIYNFAGRCTYHFEAQSILQHIHRRLLNHDGQIPDPLAPMNPYTNEPFSLPQILGVYEATKLQGKSAWTFEAFQKAKFSIDGFFLLYRKPLRLHALKSILYNYTEWEGREMLLNFIESQHEEHQALFSKNLYAFFLRELPDESKIQQWRSLCKDYYEREILAEDDDQRDIAFSIAKGKSGPLCAPPHDLIVKRDFYLKSKKDGGNSSRGVSNP